MKNSPLLLLLTFILGFVLLSSGLVRLSTLSPRFEGAKCYFYGASFNFDSGWEGTYQLHEYQQSAQTLAYKEGQVGWISTRDEISWGVFNTPNDASLRRTYTEQGLMTIKKVYPDLIIDVESSPALEDITRQGDPIGWNTSDPNCGRRVEYWTETLRKIEQTQETVKFHVNLTKHSFIVVPAEFWIGFYVEPSQTDASTGSGWREGEWQNVQLWFMLRWDEWTDAYQIPWLDDPQDLAYQTHWDGTITEQQRNYAYRGGFPIAGFIKGWEKAGTTSDYYLGKQEDSIWIDIKEADGETKRKTATQLDMELRERLLAKCRTSPSMVGDWLMLYDSPDAEWTYDLEDTDFSEDHTSDKIQTPDPRMKEVMYFPITIRNLGTLAEGSWTGPWDIYYPSCYFRIRMLYGVYGTFTYLWTEEVRLDPLIDYPDEIERQGTTVIHVEGLGGAGSQFWSDFLTNPFTYIWTGIIILVLGFATLIILAFFAPELLKVLGLGLEGIAKHGKSR